MGGNASTGLGSADQHSLRDMKSLEAYRPNHRDEDINRKSLFPATKALYSTQHGFEGSVCLVAPTFYGAWIIG